MKILVLNCGSSSLKYQLIDMTNEEVLRMIKNKKVDSIRISTRPDYINKEILKMLKTKKEATKSTQETRNIKKIEVLKPELSLEKASNISHLPLPSVRQQPDCYAPLP